MCFPNGATARDADLARATESGNLESSRISNWGVQPWEAGTIALQREFSSLSPRPEMEELRFQSA